MNVQQTEPEVVVRSVRVGATDVAETAAFYQEVFGLKEMFRVERDEQLVELIMNFGASAEEAMVNRATGIVVVKSPVPLATEAVSPIILNVQNIEAVVEKVKTNNGTVDSPPKALPYGFTISMVRDPSGNRIELVKQEGQELPSTVSI